LTCGRIFLEKNSHQRLISAKLNLHDMAVIKIIFCTLLFLLLIFLINYNFNFRCVVHSTVLDDDSTSLSQFFKTMDSENIFEKFKLPAQLNGDSTKNFDKKRNLGGVFLSE
jgi:hypothetical protein